MMVGPASAGGTGLPLRGGRARVVGTESALRANTVPPQFPTPKSKPSIDKGERGRAPPANQQRYSPKVTAFK